MIVDISIGPLLEITIISGKAGGDEQNHHGSEIFTVKSLCVWIHGPRTRFHF